MKIEYEGIAATSVDSVEAQTGQKIEPEEAPAQVVIGLTPDLSMSNPTSDLIRRVEEKTGRSSIPTEVTVASTIGDLAAGIRSRCEHCKFFDYHAFRKFKRARDNPSDMQGFRMMNQLRYFIQQAGLSERAEAANQTPDNELDVEHLLATEMGICQAHTEMKKDVLYVLKDSTCPQGEPNLFQIRDPTAEKKSSAEFDAIMALALKKGPR